MTGSMTNPAAAPNAAPIVAVAGRMTLRPTSQSVAPAKRAEPMMTCMTHGMPETACVN
jgi:hypothetical protein